MVPPSESISTADVLDSKPKQRLLSQKIEEAGFSSLIQESSTAVKARLRAVSQPQAHAWLRATPSPSLGLNLGSSEMQVLLKFWLGLPLDSPTDLCPFCSSALDAMGHHSLTCKHGGFVIARHNRLRDCLAHFCQIAGLAPEVEKGCNFGSFDLKVINPLNSDSILEASMIPGSTAEKGERDKHLKNDGPCNERGWSCIPLVVEVYGGGWGQEAVSMFARLSKLLSLHQRQSCSAALNELYCHLSVVLMR
ncbi:hypothetical protein EMCRGX_G030646 [Ephydatia muelleri]